MERVQKATDSTGKIKDVECDVKKKKQTHTYTQIIKPGVKQVGRAKETHTHTKKKLKKKKKKKKIEKL